MPRVSVVVPSYNNAAHIRLTLQSIVDQSFTDFELIVADHSSTDGTREIVEEFRDDPRVSILSTAPGGGAPRNWNRVSQAASAEYLKLVCGDDVLHPEALQKQWEGLSSEPRAVLAASPRRIVDSSGRVVFQRRGLAGLAGVVPGDEAIRRCVRAGTNIFGEPACVMIRREALEDVGWWDPRFPYAIDQATYTAVLGRGSFLAIPEVLADFRLSDTQWSVALAAQQHRQVADFHRWLGEEYPHVISRQDVRVGDARARVTAFARRAVYFGLAHRMR